MRHVIGLTVLAALAAGGCNGSDNAAATDASRAAMTRMLDEVKAALPNVRLAEVAAYDVENLYEAIDGAAPYFIDAGFVRLVRGEWRPADAKGDAYVEMEWYDMGSPLGAMDILADSRTEKTAYLAIGNEAHLSDDLLELRTGPYYVKLTPRRDAAAVKTLLQTVAREIAKAAPPGPTDEALVAPLPAEKMVPHSAAFAVKDFLDRDFLVNVREATYQTDGERVRLFLMTTDNPDKARAAFVAWRQSVPAAPPTGRDLPNMLTAAEPYVGTVIVAHHKRYLAGAIGDPLAARPLLESFLKRLE